MTIDDLPREELLRRLRAAEARIDALEGLLDGTEVHIQRTETGGVRLYIDYDVTEIGVGPNLRVAIDAARKP